jgi:hypothetical protein
MSWHTAQRWAGRSLGRPGGASGPPNGCNGEGGPDAPLSEMLPSFRPGRLSDAPDELVLDLLLDGVSPSPEAPPELAGLLPMLADLFGPAEPGELAAEAAVLSRFRSRVRPARISGAPRAARRASPRPRLVPHSPRVSAALATVAIALAGTAAAYAGALPPALQDFAHHTIGAPAVRHASQPPGHGPRHQPAITQAGSGSSRHAPQSAVPGTGDNHTEPGHGADTGRTAEPRPWAEPSSQSGRGAQTGPPPHPSLPPSARSHPRQSNLPQPSPQPLVG